MRTARYVDAHADRVLLSPTAAPHPEGTVYRTNYELLFIQAGYALTDRTQVSIAGVTDFTNNVIAELTLKANVYRGRALRVALLSAIDLLVADDENLALGRVGGTVQWCFEVVCHSSLSVSLMAVLHDEPDLLFPLGAAAGLVVRVSDVASVLLEYSGLFNAAGDIAIVSFPQFLVSYGVRLSGSPHWSLDLALMRRMETLKRSDLPEQELFALLGLPLVAFTYRFGGAL